MHSGVNMVYAGAPQQMIMDVPKRPPSFTWLQQLKQSKTFWANRMIMPKEPKTKLVDVSAQTGTSIAVPWMYSLLVTERSMMAPKSICTCEWTAYINRRHWRTTFFWIMHSGVNMVYAGAPQQMIMDVPKRPPSFTWLQQLKQSKTFWANRMIMPKEPKTKLVDVSTQTGTSIAVPWMYNLLPSERSKVAPKSICSCEWTAYINRRHWRTTFFGLVMLSVVLVILDCSYDIISTCWRLTKR